jgi:hypothetical protein
MSAEWDALIHDFNTVREQLQEARAVRAEYQDALDRVSAEMHRVYARFLNVEERMWQIESAGADITFDLSGKILSIQPRKTAS